MLIPNSCFIPHLPFVFGNHTFVFFGGPHCSNDKVLCVWSEDQQAWAAGHRCPRCALAGLPKLRLREEEAENMWQWRRGHKAWRVYQLPFTGSFCQPLLWRESTQTASKILGKSERASLLTSLMRGAEVGGRAGSEAGALGTGAGATDITAVRAPGAGGQGQRDQPYRHWWLPGGVMTALQGACYTGLEGVTIKQASFHEQEVGKKRVSWQQKF